MLKIGVARLSRASSLRPWPRWPSPLCVCCPFGLAFPSPLASRSPLPPRWGLCLGGPPFGVTLSLAALRVLEGLVFSLGLAAHLSRCSKSALRGSRGPRLFQAPLWVRGPIVGERPHCGRVQVTCVQFICVQLTCAELSSVLCFVHYHRRKTWQLAAGVALRVGPRPFFFLLGSSECR